IRARNVTGVQTCALPICELDLGVRLGTRVPLRERLDVLLGDVRAVLGAQQVLGEDLEGIGESLGARDGREPEDLIRFVADVKGSLGAEAVNACCHVSSTRGVSSGSSSFPAHHVMPVASPGRTRDPFWTVASVFGIQPTSTSVPFSE